MKPLRRLVISTLMVLGSAVLSSSLAAQVPAGQFPGAAPPVPPLSGAPAPQVPPRDAPPKTGTSRIRGRVVAADNGQPLRKAQVRAVSSELRESRLATTNYDGAYEFTELPAGRYQLTASKGSFVQLQYGQTRPFDTGKQLELGERQTLEKVDFGLPRGSLITGLVLDEFGEPATDVQVSALHYQFVQGSRQLAPAGRIVTTNDIGEYRLFGLPPGQYFVSATFRSNNPADLLATTSERSGYAPTYYPSTTSVAGATRLRVEVGQTRNGIDITLATTRLAHIAGSVVNSDGKPLANGVVVLMQPQSGPTASGGSQVKPDGTFAMSNVAPGDYTLVAMDPTSMFNNGGMPEFISAHVTVAGDDIDGLQLAGFKSVSVTGRVLVPQSANGAVRASTLQLMTVPLRPDLALGLGGAGKVNDDFTFELKVQPGQRVIRLGPQSQAASVKAVRLNGEDVTDSGIDFRPNQDVSGLEIELTTLRTDLSGSVTDNRNQPVKDYSVVIFARDRQRWMFGSRFLSSGRPYQDGRYRVGTLPPGDYYAIALDYVEPGSDTDPEFLERCRSRATEFSLTEGQTRTLDLKIVNGL